MTLPNVTLLAQFSNPVAGEFVFNSSTGDFDDGVFGGERGGEPAPRDAEVFAVEATRPGAGEVERGGRNGKRGRKHGRIDGRGAHGEDGVMGLVESLKGPGSARVPRATNGVAPLVAVFVGRRG